MASLLGTETRACKNDLKLTKEHENAMNLTHIMHWSLCSHVWNLRWKDHGVWNLFHVLIFLYFCIIIFFSWHKVAWQHLAFHSSSSYEELFISFFPSSSSNSSKDGRERVTDRKMNLTGNISISHLMSTQDLGSLLILSAARVYQDVFLIRA